MKPTLATLKRLAAKEAGATVDCVTAGLAWMCHVDLPAGKIIQGAHGACESALASDKAAQVKAIERLIEWLSHPVEDGCELDDPAQCDVCNAL